jgi:hypothetical protein
MVSPRMTIDSACSPSAASLIRYPYSCRRTDFICAISGLSSTISRVAPIASVEMSLT